MNDTARSVGTVSGHRQTLAASPVAISVILILTAIAAPLHMNKVSPIAPLLMADFGIGEADIGVLISVFSLTGIVLALPGGMLVRRFGPWKCILASLVFLLSGSVAGSAAGAVSGAYPILLISRIVEGIGMTFMAVAGPSIIGVVVGDKRRGLAMGAFAGYMGYGQVIAFNIVPQLSINAGWKGAWWFASAYTAVVAIIWVLLMVRLKVFAKRPATATAAAADEASASLPPQAGAVFRNKSIWLLSVSMALYIMSYVTIQMFMAPYLATGRGFDMTTASSLVSICCFTGTVFSLFAGMISDKLGSRRLFGGAALILAAVLYAIIPATPDSSFVILLVILGIIPPILPVCAFAAATETVGNPALGGIAIGMLTLGQNIGFVVGPVLFGTITQGFGWNAAFMITVPITVVGGVVMLLNKKVR